MWTAANAHARAKGKTTTDNATIKRIVRSFRRYNLTLRSYECKANLKTRQYEYFISAARRHSGARGGRERNQRCWVLVNLMPEQRHTLLELPRERAFFVYGEGCRHGYRLLPGATAKDMVAAFGPGRLP